MKNIFFSILWEGSLLNTPCSLERLAEGLKSDKTKRRDAYIRKLHQKKYSHNGLKRRLPSIMVGGRFVNSTELDLIEYSQIVCLEFKSIDMNGYRAENSVKKCPYTLFSFKFDPSRHRYVFVRVNSGLEHHKLACQQVKDYYENLIGLTCVSSEKIDTQIVMPYDTKYYLNTDSVLFNVDFENLDRGEVPDNTNVKHEILPIVALPKAS